MGVEFNVEEFLVREMKDLNKKLDENTGALQENINGLKTCIHNKVDEVKKDVNKKFADHATLHLNNAKSFITTRLFIFAMVIIVGSIGTISLLANNNRNDITEIKTKQEMAEKVMNENGISITDSNK